MIRLSENLWIGDSLDEEHADLATEGIRAILNVARDLQATRGWMHCIEYTQVGLIDGPGNSLTLYYAAILGLTDLLKRHKVLVCCHSGSRSLAVSVMQMQLMSGRSWRDCLNLIRERVQVALPEVHEAHKAASARLETSFANLGHKSLLSQMGI